MASKEDFMQSLRALIETHKGWLLEISTEVQTRTATISRLNARRQEVLATLAQSILPNLEVATLDALSTKLPGFLTIQSVEQNRHQKLAGYDAELNELAFVPESYESTHLGLSVQLDTEKKQLTQFEESVTYMEGIPDLKRLIKCGYGTTDYLQQWWNLQYYIDWCMGDRIMGQLDVSTWDGVVSRYNSMVEMRDASNRDVVQLQAELETLEQAKMTYERLLEAKRNVDLLVLEQFQIQLKARLDNFQTVPDWMGEIADIDARITREQEAINGQLHERREMVSNQLTKLEELRQQAQKSRIKEVPDKVLAALQGGAPPSVRVRDKRRGQAPSSQVVYVGSSQGWNSSDWLIQDAIYHSMFDHFSHDHHGHHHYDRHDEGSGHNTNFATTGQRSSVANEEIHGRLS